MHPPLLLLRVAATWPLPGLGLLALPAGPAPALAAYPLHYPLAVAVHLPDGTRQTSSATVEEVSRPDDETGPVRGLLLDLGSVRTLPDDTHIYLGSALIA